MNAPVAASSIPDAALAPPTGQDIRVETAPIVDIGALRTAWDSLFASRSNEPSTSFEWTSAMLRHHVTRDDVCLLTRLSRGAREIGFVPLIARTSRVLGQPVVTLAPISELYNTHSDLLVCEANQDAVDAFVAELFRLGIRWDRMRFSKLLEDNPLLGMLESSLRRHGAVFHTQQGLPAYVLQLPHTFDEYLEARSGKFRNYLRRLQRRIHSAGQPSVISLTDRSLFDSMYGHVLTIERASWKQEHGTAISAIPRQTGFYREMAKAAFEAGRLHLHVLLLDSVPVAYDLGYIVDGRYYYLKTSYDHSYRHVSPATFLRARLIEELIGRGISLFDFPGEPFDWERQWTDTVRWHKTVSIYPATIRGRLLAGLDRIRRRASAERTVQHVDPRALRAEARGSAEEGGQHP